MGELARRYAQALYSVYDQERGLADGIKTLTGSQQLWEALCNPCVTRCEKHAVLDDVCKETPPAVLTFLKLLSDGGRMSELPAIGEAFHALALAAADALPATLWYAVPPDQNTIAKVKETLKKTYGKKQVELKLRQDGSLLGGFVVEAAGKRVDSSVQGMLAAMRADLLTKSPAAPIAPQASMTPMPLLAARR